MDLGVNEWLGWKPECLALFPATSRLHPFSPPWSCRFHCPDREWARESDVRLPVHEGDQLSAPEYRKRLYQVLEL